MLKKYGYILAIILAILLVTVVYFFYEERMEKIEKKLKSNPP